MRIAEYTWIGKESKKDQIVRSKGVERVLATGMQTCTHPEELYKVVSEARSVKHTPGELSTNVLIIQIILALWTSER